MRKLVMLLLLLFLTLPATARATSADDIAQVQSLSEGYSLLYLDTQALANAHRDTVLKSAGDGTEAVVGDLASYLKVLAGELRQMADAYPSLKIDLNPLPEAERRRRAARAGARVAGFSPVQGRVGADFERALLLSLAGGVNELRHMARVLEDAEEHGERKRAMNRASKRLDGLYEKMQRELNRRFYKLNLYAE